MDLAILYRSSDPLSLQRSSIAPAILYRFNVDWMFFVMQRAGIVMGWALRAACRSPPLTPICNRRASSWTPLIAGTPPPVCRIPKMNLFEDIPARRKLKHEGLRNAGRPARRIPVRQEVHDATDLSEPQEPAVPTPLGPIPRLALLRHESHHQAEHFVTLQGTVQRRHGSHGSVCLRRLGPECLRSQNPGPIPAP